jgi:hypothetical protein
MEFIDRRKIVDGQVLDVLTGFGERCKYPVQQTAFAVMLCNLFGHRAFPHSAKTHSDGGDEVSRWTARMPLKLMVDRLLSSFSNDP